VTQVWERAFAAWPLVAAEILIFGTAVFALLIAPSPESQPDGVANSLMPLWRGLALLAFFVSPLVLLVDAAAMADVSLGAAIPFLPQVMRETHLGRLWLWGLPVTVLLLIAAWMPGCRPVKIAVLGILTGALLVVTSLSGHAIDRGAIAIAVYFAHEVAAALWIGGILGLWLGVVHGGLGPEWVRQTAPRVSNLAGWTVTLLILSGLYAAYHSLDADPQRLIYAAYGRTLVVKVCAASLVLLIGAYNRYWLIPTVSKSPSQRSLLRNIGVESVLLIGVLGLAALLANTPPAH
jgi:putative copper resistance protein D